MPALNILPAGQKTATLKRAASRKAGDMGGQPDQDVKLVQQTTEGIVAGYQFAKAPSDVNLNRKGSTISLKMEPPAFPPDDPPPSRPPAPLPSSGSPKPTGSVPTTPSGTLSGPPSQFLSSPGTTLKKRPTLKDVASTVITTRRNSKRESGRTKGVETITGQDGREIVCIGSLYALVGLFATKGALNTNFVLEFLATHRQFTTSLSALQYMLSFAGSIGATSSAPADDELAQARIFVVLEQWLARHPGDFVVDDKAHAKLSKFLEVVKVAPKNSRRFQDIKRLLLTARERAAQETSQATDLFSQTISGRISQLPDFLTATASSDLVSNTLQPSSSSPPASSSPRQNPSLANNFYYTRASKVIPNFPEDFKPAHLAELLTMEESRLFLSLTQEEFELLVERKDTALSRIKTYSRWSQLVPYWVATEVCKPEEQKNRIEVIKFFLQAASLCLQLQNFNALYEIMGGLSLSPCQRLIKTWKALPAASKKTYQDLSALVSSKDNYVAYRTALQQCTGDVLPIFRVYLADLAVVTGKMDSELPDSRINFYKFHVIGNILSSIYTCQRNIAYTFQINTSLREYVSDLVAASALLDTDSLAKLSRAREQPSASMDSVIFGIDLRQAVEKTGVIASTDITVPACVRDIVEALRQNRLKTLGLFRRSGNQSTIKKMKSQIDLVGGLVFDFESVAPHDLAGLLKLYFAELPDPVFTGALSPKFTAAADIPDQAKRLEQLQRLIAELPNTHFHLAIYLLHLLNEVSREVASNSMDARNLAVCFAPTLFGRKKPVRQISVIKNKVNQVIDGAKKGDSLEADVKKQEQVAQVLQLMIECYKELAPSATFGTARIDYSSSSAGQF